MGDLKHPEVLQLHGTRNSLNHIINCENGGYANYRHDNVRDAIAEYLRQICKDVTIEPNLIPIKVDQTRAARARSAPREASRGSRSSARSARLIHH